MNGHRKMFKKTWLALLLWCSMLGQACAQITYTLVVVPQFPAIEIHRNWSPVLKALERETGHKFVLRIPESIPAFEREFAQGIPDFVYLNPYHMVMAHKQQKYLPLVRDNKEMLAGILVVKHDSPIQQVQQLNGQVVSFPAPNAFGASLYMRALLAEKFKISIQAQYVKTHSNAYRHVVNAQSAAAGGIRSTLDKENPELRQQLRVLYETPQTPPHPLAVHPRIPETLRTTVQQIILGMAGSEPGQAMLKQIQMTEPVKADYKKDYAPLDQLGLDKYVIADESK